MGALALLEFVEQEFIGELVVWHANYMNCPAQLDLHQDCEDAGEVGSGEHLDVWNPVLPLYA